MRGPWRGLAAALLLAGCAPLELAVEEDAEAALARLWETHRRQVAGLEAWSLQGRFGLQWRDGQAQGSVRWRQAGPELELWLSGPFGLNPVRLVGDLQAGQATLFAGATETRGELAAVLRESLGFALPLAELAALVRGIPGAPDGEVVLDGEARAVRISQGGWDVSYRDYSCCELPALPGRVKFARDALRGVLVVREWGRE